jgi:hypothetical protein
MSFPTQAKSGLEWATIPIIPTYFWKQAPRYALLQRLQCIGQRSLLRFAEQKVNVLRHDHVRVDLKPEAAPHTFQCRFEGSSACGRGKQSTAMVAAESDEMTLFAVMKTGESPRHEGNLALFAGFVCDV